PTTSNVTDHVGTVQHLMHKNSSRPGAIPLGRGFVYVSHRPLDLVFIEVSKNPQFLNRYDPAPTDDRVLLILALPAGLRHRSLALQQKRQTLVLGKQGFTLKPVLLVCLGYGGVTKDFGFGKALDESANRIIKVPPRHDHDQACRVAEPSEEVFRKPMQNLVASCLAGRLGSALDWIIHDSEVQALTGDLASIGGVVK